MLRTGGEAPSRGYRVYVDETLRAGEQGTSTSVAGRSSTGVLERSCTGAGERDEDRLVAAVRCGDDDAFELIYRRYRDRIGAYVRGLVGDYARAEDITQEVFLAALRRMRQTEAQILLKPWLYEIAKNACIDHFRRTRRAEEVSFDADFQLGAADQDRLTAPIPGPDAMVDTKHQLDTLCGAFGSLSDIHHEILILRELEGRSYREIGERLGLTRPAVESTLFRARRRLVQEYDELDSGRSCLRVQGSIRLAAAHRLGSRDRRRMAKHLSHCAECRRQAALLGVGREALAAAQRGAMARVAALLPWPLVFARRLFDAKRESAWLAAPGHGARVARWSSGISQTGDGAGMVWSKLVVSAVAVAALSMGAGRLPAGGPAVKHAPRARPVPARSVAHSRRRASTERSARSARARRHARRARRARELRSERSSRAVRHVVAGLAIPFDGGAAPLPRHVKAAREPGRREPRSRSPHRRASQPALSGFSNLPANSPQSGHHPLSHLLGRVTSLARGGLQRIEASRPRIAGAGEARRAGKAATANGGGGGSGGSSSPVHSSSGPVGAPTPPPAAPPG